MTSGTTAPDVERVFDDGTTVAADEPLPPGLYISRRDVDVDYDHHDGVTLGATEFIETTRITPQMRQATAGSSTASRGEAGRHGSTPLGRERRSAAALPLDLRARLPLTIRRRSRT